MTLWGFAPDRWAVDGHSIIVAESCRENWQNTVVRDEWFLPLTNPMVLENYDQVAHTMRNPGEP